jgi:exosome complex RNA-binding protein Rrp4
VASKVKQAICQYIIKWNIFLLGQRLAQLDDRHIGGQGTYVRDGYIYSSLAGTMEMAKGAQGKVSNYIYLQNCLDNLKWTW